MHHFNRLLGIGLCLLASWGPGAAAGSSPGQAAVAACRVESLGLPRDVQVVTEVEDGSGGRLVWLTDKAANLWICGVDGQGRVYLHDLIFDDLLRGAGAKLLPALSVDRGGKPVLPADLLGIAESACKMHLDDAAITVLDSGPDGLTGDWVPGYFVYLGTEAGETYLCNATANARVWVFAKVTTTPPPAQPVG